MIVVLTACAPSLDAPLDPHFGRCAYFLIVDADAGVCRTYANPALSTAGGLGLQAAEFAAALQPAAVISGDFGPKAFASLTAAGIALYRAGPMPAREALAQFKAGQLEPATAPSQALHHGLRDEFASGETS